MYYAIETNRGIFEGRNQKVVLEGMYEDAIYNEYNIEIECIIVIWHGREWCFTQERRIVNKIQTLFNQERQSRISDIKSDQETLMLERGFFW